MLLPVRDILDADGRELLDYEDLAAGWRDRRIEVGGNENFEDRANRVAWIVGGPVVSLGCGEFLWVHTAQSDMREEAREAGLERFQLLDRPTPAMFFSDKMLVRVERISVGDHD